MNRLQGEQLNILLEVKRVCEKNGIRYFLLSGTLLGAVRHKGFIPWDDDLDIGMLRSDYERFREIVETEMDKDYIFQDWHNEINYPLPFGKVRKRGTVYIENKSNRLKENGIFIDVFPMDYASETKEETKRINKKLTGIERVLIAQCGFQPWREQKGINIVKWIGYIPYRMMGKMKSRSKLIEEYEKIVFMQKVCDYVYEQEGVNTLYYFSKSIVDTLIEGEFEGYGFPIFANYDEYLTEYYGDYMILPPENERGNRHQVLEIKYSES